MLLVVGPQFGVVDLLAEAVHEAVFHHGLVEVCSFVEVTDFGLLFYEHLHRPLPIHLVYFGVDVEGLELEVG